MLGMDLQNQYLRQLYGDELAPGISARIEALHRKYGDTQASSVDARLSEKDVLLITYGDTFTKRGVVPLKVLRRFYREYLRGVFELVHVLPFHPYSSDDGFSVIDYFAVRDDLGSWSDIGDLAEDCRIMADAVINHISSRSEWFTKFLDGAPEFADYFIECDPDTDVSAVVRPRTSPLLTRFEDREGGVHHIWTTFSADQVDLNFRNPDVLVAIIDVLFFIISKGARLLRLDAVTFLWKEIGTSSTNLPETHVLIKILRHAIGVFCKDVVVVTETNVPHRENIAYFGDGHDEAHMVYNFALPPLMAYSFIVGDGRRLSEWAGQLSTPSDQVCFLNFSASHDGVGVRPVEEILTDKELRHLVDAAIAANGLVSSRTLADGGEHPYELNCTFLDLISKDSDEISLTVARFIAAQAIVLVMPGVPAIYIQSLLGTRNDLQRVAQTGRARSINRSQHDFSDIAGKLSDDSSLESRIFSALTFLITVRRGQTAFNPYASFHVLELGRQVFAIRRGDTGAGDSISCIVNLAAEHVAISVDDETAGTDLLSGNVLDVGQHELSPYAVRWLRNSRQDWKYAQELL